MFDGLRLLKREDAKDEEYGGINGDGVIYECANYMNVLRGQQEGVVVVISVLDFDAVGGGFSDMWVLDSIESVRLLIR